MALPQSFVWGANGSQLTPEQIERQRQIADALTRQSIDTSPVGSWTQGAARVADAIAGAFARGRADRAEKAGKKSADDQVSGIDWGGMFGGGDTSVTPGAPGGAYPASVAAGGSPTAPAATGVGIPPELKDTITGTEAKYGLPSGVLSGIATIESGGRADAANPNSSARGLFQFTNGTAKQYGLTNPLDPIASTDAAGRLAADNAKALQAAGIPINAGTLYLAHQQGAGGAIKLLSNPNAPASSIVGDEAIRLNGGHQKMTAGEFANLWMGKIDGVMGGGAGGAPVQVASTDPASGMGSFTPEQLGAGNKLMPSPAPDTITVPPREEVAAPAPVAAIGGPGQPMAQPPMQDATYVPSLSAAPNIPFVGQDGVSPGVTQVAAALSGSGGAPAPVATASAPASAVSPGVAQVASALSPQDTATSDRALGGIMAPAGTPQPQNAALAGYFPPAPSNAPGGPSGDFPPAPAPANPAANMQKLMALVSNPFASPAQRAMAANTIQELQRRNDPAYQLDLEAKRLAIDTARKKPTDKFSTTTLPDGTVIRLNENTGEVTPVYQGAPKQNESVEALKQRAALAGLKDGTPEYAEFMRTQGKGPQTVITNTNGGGNDFYKKLDEKSGENVSGISEQGNKARQNMVLIKRLGDTLKVAPTGLKGALKGLAGRWGIKTDGVDDIESATAIINQMVPNQRTPGSGTMSDGDVALFKASLPSLMNTKEGNRKIIDTMTGIAQYQSDMGDIADMVADRTITPAEGRKRMRELANPLEGFADSLPKDSGSSGGNKGPVKINGYTIQEE